MPVSFLLTALHSGAIVTTQSESDISTDVEREEYSPKRDPESRGQVKARYQRRRGMGPGVAWPNEADLQGPFR